MFLTRLRDRDRIGGLLTALVAVIFTLPTPQVLGGPVTQAPAYLITLPYHPLLNLLVWPCSVGHTWRAPGRVPTTPKKRCARAVMKVDCRGDRPGGLDPGAAPWAMKFREFYGGYQPWIMLIDLVILAYPLLASALMRRFAAAA